MLVVVGLNKSGTGKGFCSSVFYLYVRKSK